MQAAGAVFYSALACCWKGRFIIKVFLLLGVVLKKEHLEKVQGILDPEKSAEKVKEVTIYLGKEYKKTLALALSAGLAVIIGLYVKDLLTLWIDYVLVALKLSGGAGLLYKTVLTLAVVAIAVVGIVLVNKWAGQEQKKV